MSTHMKLATLTALAVAAGLGTASAAELKQIATIQLPSGPTKGFDITWVDQKTQRVYLADRDHGSLDIFDGNNNSYIGSVPGFVGPKMENGKVSNEISGPAGVLTDRKSVV